MRLRFMRTLEERLEGYAINAVSWVAVFAMNHVHLEAHGSRSLSRVSRPRPLVPERMVLSNVQRRNAERILLYVIHVDVDELDRRRRLRG